MAQRLARGAHNSEVTRSKRVAGIQPITSHRCIKALEHQSPVAQRKRAVKHRQLPTRFEKIRQTDGYRLMSRRTHDRNVSGESYNSAALQKLLVIAKRRTYVKHSKGNLRFPYHNHSHGGRLIVEHNQDTHNVRKFDGYLFLIKRQAQDRYLWVVNGDGAEEARGAHNSEVLGSSPSSRIF